ncbi:hypothetical protein IFM89_015979 [Coptis chinensis]|uniref:DUF3730 domain-containing protein n=1 Tax=Coptis chinensis TaxID=261450 RepID=A0A835HU01_9MAGN|nr:hypothetical protein IFM89_015979 [Coptis chinensis]
MQCLKYFPSKNADDFKDIYSVAENLVDAYTVALKQAVETGLLKNHAQSCGVELVETLLSFYTDLGRHFDRKEVILELSKRVLLIQKQFGLPYLCKFSSLLTSFFIILTRAQLEHEQLSVLKLSFFLLKWESEIDCALGRSAHDLMEELLFLLPVINLLSSPSRSVKAAATNLLLVLEKLITDLLSARKEVSVIQEEVPFISKFESVICRLFQRLWFQEHPSFGSYFLCLSSNCKSEVNSELKSWLSHIREYCLHNVEKQRSPVVSQRQENVSTELPLLLSSVVAGLVVHHSLESYAIDTLATLGIMDPKLGMPLLFSVLFYSKLFSKTESGSYRILLKLLEMLPSVASHPAMTPLVVQTIWPMLSTDEKPVLRATANRLLCKTWEVTDLVFASLQGALQPKGFMEFAYEQDICISMAASVRDVCRKDPDRGVDLILSVSACIESLDPIVQALGFQSLGYLCEADVVDFYTAWTVIEKQIARFAGDPTVAHGISILLRWGAMDVEAHLEASKTVLDVLWKIGTVGNSAHESKWVKAKCSAFESLTQYEVEHIQKNIPDFKRRNFEFLVSEDNPDVLRALERFAVKIITFQHNHKLLPILRYDVYVGTQISWGCYFNLQELPKLHAAFETALVDVAESLQLSRNPLVALLSLQSFKPFMQQWVNAVVMLLDAKVKSCASEKTTEAASLILKKMRRIAEESIPRSAENIALCVGALCLTFEQLKDEEPIVNIESGRGLLLGCKSLIPSARLVTKDVVEVLPPSAHTVTTTVGKFLLEWLFQFEHEHRQWSAAITLGLVSRCSHATDHKQKFDIITGLLKVACSSRSTLVKGACGVGLGLACQNLLAWVEAADGSSMDETSTMRVVNLVGRTVRTLSMIICQLSPSSSDSLQRLSDYFPLDTDELFMDPTSDVPYDNASVMEVDVWGIAGLIHGLGNSVSAIYRAGGRDAVITLKAILISWIPHVQSVTPNTNINNVTPELLLSIGSCLALPVVIDFCLRVELVTDDELNDIVSGFSKLISELLSVEISGTFHQSLSMASCIGGGSLLSCILDYGVHSVKIEDVKGLLELLRKSYTNQYPTTIQFGGMLGVVNAFGACAGTLSQRNPKSPSLHSGLGQKDSCYIRGPILSEPVFEQLSTSLVNEMFLAAQEVKCQPLQNYAAWALSFLRYKLRSKEPQIFKNNSLKDQMDSNPVSQTFPEDSVVWQLSLWLMELSYVEVGFLSSLSEELCQNGNVKDVNLVATFLRCLSQAPRLPSLDWGASIRRCMRYEDQVSSKLSLGEAHNKGTLRIECIMFALAHANHVNPLLLFLDELYEVSRFKTLELNLQTCLLCHLAEVMNIFSGSRLEKLYGDMDDYFSCSSSLFQVYNLSKKSLLRVSFWKGLGDCLEKASVESLKHINRIEKCMQLLFSSLPLFHIDASSRMDQANSLKEWSEAIRCMGKAPQNWLMDLLEIPEVGFLQGGNHFQEVVKRARARVRLVMIGRIPLTGLGKLRSIILHTESDGIWDVLVEVVSVLQKAESSIKRQWFVDAVELGCITNYPSTALKFLGMLAGSFCKYMPLLVLDKITVLSDLPVTVPLLFSERDWMVIAEPVVLNLWRLTERIYEWAKCLESAPDVASKQHFVDESESNIAVFLSRVMYHTCLTLKDYLPFEKQLKLTSMVIP